MKDDLRQLIIKGKTDQVLKKLLKVAEELEDDRLREKVMLLSASYEKHSENELLGLSYGEEQRVSIAKINKALLHLINQLPDEPLTATKPRRGEKMTEETKGGWEETASLAKEIIVIYSGRRYTFSRYS